MMAGVENFHTVDQWAVTQLACQSAIFHWTIKNYAQVSKKGKSLVCSDKFDEELHTSAGLKQRKWQIVVRPQKSQVSGREFLSIHLYLMEDWIETFYVRKDTGKNFSEKKENQKMTWGTFKVTLTDGNGTVLKQAGGRGSDHRQFPLTSGWGFNNFVRVDLLMAKDSKLLPGGDLHLTVHIWISGEPRNYRSGNGGVWYSQQILAKEEEEMTRMQMDFKRLFKDTTLADFKIRVLSSPDDKTFTAHKVVLAASSPVFLAMFNDEQETQECKEGLVTITDFDAPVVQAMLEYMYTNSIGPGFLQQNAVDMLRIADKYCLTQLRDICEETIYANLDAENCMEILVIADMHQCVWLKTKCMEFIEANRKHIKKTGSLSRVLKQYPYASVDLYLFDPKPEN